jgi:hypothetical protein
MWGRDRPLLKHERLLLEDTITRCLLFSDRQDHSPRASRLHGRSRGERSITIARICTRTPVVLPLQRSVGASGNVRGRRLAGETQELERRNDVELSGVSGRRFAALFDSRAVDDA